MATVFLLSSYLHRISQKENSACSTCGHPLQDLNHLLLDCPASEPLRKSIFGSSLSILDLWSRPWCVARLLGLRGVPPCPHTSEGSGSTTTTRPVSISALNDSFANECGVLKLLDVINHCFSSSYENTDASLFFTKSSLQAVSTNFLSNLF